MRRLSRIVIRWVHCALSAAKELLERLWVVEILEALLNLEAQ
jgi:hypothetical protein